MKSDEFLDFGKFKIQDLTPLPELPQPGPNQPQRTTLRRDGWTKSLPGPVFFFRVLSQDYEMYRATRLKAEMNEEIA